MSDKDFRRRMLEISKNYGEACGYIGIPLPIVLEHYDTVHEEMMNDETLIDTDEKFLEIYALNLASLLLLYEETGQHHA